MSRRRKAGAFQDWLRWQTSSRLAPGPIVVPFIEGSVLVTEPGMVGATGNIYHGLHEFEEMGFALLFARERDFFGDIGANVGSYAILLGGVVGARGIAAEPIPTTAARLERNLIANRLTERIRIAHTCVGRAPGTVRMRVDQDAMNRVVTSGGTNTREVPQTTLDSLFASERPTILKIDTEGYELDVLAGATECLASETLRAIIIEISGPDAHASEVVSILVRAGFTAVHCDPWRRSLTPRNDAQPMTGNVLFVRDLGEARERVRSARTFDVKGLPL